METASLNHNQKLAVRWKQEHKEIVSVATKIIQDYEKNEKDILGMDINTLNTLTSLHLMDEDMELFQFSMLADSLDDDIQKQIEEFIETFEETKLVLTDFLTKYTLPKAVYDQAFIDTFKQLVKVLGERIAYEENNLYKLLEEN